MQQKISKTKEEVFKQTGLDVKNPVLSAVFDSRKVLSERELVEKLKNMTPQQWRDMQIAGQLNKVLTANEKLGKYRDDAKATAEGIQILANWNTKNGKLNVQGFRNDLGKFYIDQAFEHAKSLGSKAIGLASVTLHGVGESPLASKLFGYNRSQSHGWNERYVEFNNRNANQAHHFAAFVIAGIDNGKTLADFEAIALDSELSTRFLSKYIPKIPDIGVHRNGSDIRLGKVGATIGQEVRNNGIPSNQIGAKIYQRIKGE
jgi:hypothetical protein